MIPFQTEYCFLYIFVSKYFYNMFYCIAGVLIYHGYICYTIFYIFLYVFIVLLSYFMINKAILFIKIKLYEIMPQTNNPWYDFLPYWIYLILIFLALFLPERPQWKCKVFTKKISSFLLLLVPFARSTSLRMFFVVNYFDFSFFTV